MLKVATGWRPDVVDGRFVIITRHGSRAWEVIVEPGPTDALLIVVTAYQVRRA